MATVLMFLMITSCIFAGVYKTNQLLYRKRDQHEDDCLIHLPIIAIVLLVVGVIGVIIKLFEVINHV